MSSKIYRIHEERARELEQQEGRRRDELGVEALRIAGHDFKTPLTTLRTVAHLFQMGLEKGTLATQPDRTARNCRILSEQVDRLVELTDVLLDVARSYGGRLKLDRKPSDLRQAVRGACARYEASQAVSALELPESEIIGEWDENRLQSAFSILLSEAKKVRVQVELDHDDVVIRMDGDYKPEAERYVPAFYVARTAIEMHGGTISGRYEIRVPRGQHP